jgi:YidC/Oxa1 family membrane protein insertase
MRVVEARLGKRSVAVSDLVDLERATWQHEPVPKAELASGQAHVPTNCSAGDRFVARLPRLGLEVVKTFWFIEPERKEGGDRPIDGRHLLVDVALRNLGSEPVTLQYELRAIAGIMPEPAEPPVYPDNRAKELAALRKRQSRDIEAVFGVLADRSVELETFDPGDVEDGPQDGRSDRGSIIYAGAKNRYFAAVLSPRADNHQITGVRVERVGQHNIGTTVRLVSETIEPGAGQASIKRYMLFIAPRVPDVLRDYPAEYHFEELVDYSWPAPIVRVLSTLLRYLRMVTPNYGWAIVVLTIFVRICLHPLTLKSQKSAFAMQKLQPLVKELREKYKDDKRLQNQKMMELWKEHGVNPMGGCLPMLLQLPIFMGLWRSLYQNAALRHAPFMLWIDDLSKPDGLLIFDEPMFLVGRSFNLLPILCGVTMMISQRLMATPSADPQVQQQQKMMRIIMPLMFPLMLYSMPSGLMLYFLCSTGFGAAEQWFIRRRLEAAEEEGGGEGPSVPVDPRRRRSSEDDEAAQESSGSKRSKPSAQKPAPQKRKKRRRKKR